MIENSLFEALPQQAAPERPPGKPRLLEPRRDQLELRSMDIDSLIGEDHAARAIWAHAGAARSERVLRADFGRGTGRATRDPPRVLLGLWMLATVEGIGSARSWRGCPRAPRLSVVLGGGVASITSAERLSGGHGELLDAAAGRRLVALLKAAWLTSGSGSPRMGSGCGRPPARPRSVACARSSRPAGGASRREGAGGPAPTSTTTRAASTARRRRTSAPPASARSASTRALEALLVLEAIKARAAQEAAPKGRRERVQEPRVSTTDPDARVMRMGDGGFRPAWNAQVVSVAGDADRGRGRRLAAVGSDRGLIRPILDKLRKRFGRLPQRHLADGGFVPRRGDIEWAHGEGIEVYCPPTQSKHGGDPVPAESRRWSGRARLAKPDGEPGGQGCSTSTRAICECIHARWRNWNLIRFNVRGQAKVGAVHALARARKQHIASRAHVERPPHPTAATSRSPATTCIAACT